MEGVCSRSFFLVPEKNGLVALSSTFCIVVDLYACFPFQFTILLRR